MRPATTKVNSVFFIFVFILCGASIMYFSKIKETASLFQSVSVYWLAIAVLAQCGTYLGVATVYKGIISLSRFAVTIPLRILAQIAVVSVSLNQIVPSAGLSGNLFLFNLFKKRGATPTQALTLILLELQSFYSTILLVLGGVIAGAISGVVPRTPFLGIAIAGVVVYGVFLLAVSVFRHTAFTKHILRIFERLRVVDTHNPLYREFLDANVSERYRGVFSQDLGGTFRVGVFQLMGMCFDALTIYGLFHGLGIVIGFVPVCIVFLATKVIALLPLTPGSLLVYEGGMTVFFTLLGVPTQVALAVTLLYRALSFWVPIPIGLLLYRRLHYRQGVY